MLKLKELSRLSRCYFSALDREDDIAAIEADHAFEAVARDVLSQKPADMQCLAKRVIIAQHYLTERPEPDGDISDLQNGAALHELLNAAIVVIGAGDENNGDASSRDR